MKVRTNNTDYIGQKLFKDSGVLYITTRLKYTEELYEKGPFQMSQTLFDVKIV